MRIKSWLIIVINTLLFSTGLFSQTFLEADSTGDAYSRIISKGFSYEVPDCVHPVRHINEVWDNELKKFVFVFDIHKTPDNDRCIYFDKQRTEIKTWDNSPDGMTANFGDTLYSRWKFRLDSSFQTSPNFSNIHQVISGDGPRVDTPFISLSPLIQNGDYMTVKYTQQNSWVMICCERTAAFRGRWVEAFEKVSFNNRGGCNIVIKSVDNDTFLLSSGNSSYFWLKNTTYMGSTWGIYRDLNSPDYLRDESIRFADFSIAKGGAVILPSAPIDIGITLLSQDIIKLSWNRSSVNEDQFRIDRSSDGIRWLYLATAKAGTNNFTDTLTSGGTYFYKVRAENAVGNSAWSDSVGGYFPLPVELYSFLLQCNGSKVKIRWSTSSEINNYGFEIERYCKDNNSGWEKIVFIKGAGSSNSSHQYEYIDFPNSGRSFYYRLKQIDRSGGYKYYKEEEVKIETPIEFSLDQNYPNPFNPSTTIKYSVPNISFINIQIIDMIGREVKTLVNEEKPAGTYSIILNADNLAGGIYFYRMRTDNFVETKKLVLLK